MTEQEKRDKAFYPMITTAYPLGADYPEVAAIQRLINADYRKACEVRKELLEELADKAEQCGGILPLRVLRNMLKEIKNDRTRKARKSD